MPSRGLLEAVAVIRTEVPPAVTHTEPDACLAILPVWMVMLLLTDLNCFFHECHFFSFP